MKSPALILPPSRFANEEELRAPYANEMLLLAFEGHHKKFEVDYEPRGETPSYRPPQSHIQTRSVGLFDRLKKLVNKLLRRDQ